MDLATTHLTADLDGLASMVALALLEGPAELALPGAMDPTANRFWEDHAAELPPLIPVRALPARLAAEPLGRLLVGDTSDPARLGLLGELAPRFREVRCWDTHPPRPEDLPRAPVAPAGAAVSGLVLELARRGAPVTPTQAGLFLLGVHTDTGHLTYASTTAIDYEAARLCLEWGADPSLPARYLPRGYSSQQLALLEAMARSAEHLEAGGVDAVILSLELESYEPDLSTLLEQLRAAEGWTAAFLLASTGGRVGVIGRAEGDLDVGSTLRALGGGGHQQAASATLGGVTLDEARALLRDALIDALEQRSRADRLATRVFSALPATASVDEAATALHQQRVNALPLYTAEREGARRWVGLVSRQEIDNALRHGLGDRPALEISAGPPAWVRAEAGLAEARRVLLQDGRRLAMVGEPPGGAIGVLTRGALFRAWEAEDLSRPDTVRPLEPQKVIMLLRRATGRLWPRLEAIGALGQELGLTAHVVGGCVRDALLGRTLADVDLVVEGSAPALARAAVARFGGRAVEHGDFGTAHWEGPDGEHIDLASARVEYYEAPAALPRVLHAELRRDLYRRDFTINAMAIALSPAELGRLTDPYGGARDLRQGLLRVLHGLSFHDDPTRAFRLARFAARFDFRAAPQTLGLLGNARRAGVLEALGPERLGNELTRILGEPSAVQAMRLLRDWELLPLIHPRFNAGPTFLEELGAVQAAWHRTSGMFEAPLDHGPEDALWLVLAAAIPAEARAERARLVQGRRAIHRWLTGPERVEAALGVLGWTDHASVAARTLSGLDGAERTVALGRAAGGRAERWLLWWAREGRMLRTAVSGEALMAAGVPRGPRVGLALRAAQEAAWDGGDEQAQLDAALAAIR